MLGYLQIVKNPFMGAKYKNNGDGTKKEPMLHPHFEQALPAMEGKMKWVCALMHHCGLRVNEAAQITSRDFVEIRGIKCVSINTNDGKTLKNLSSVRDIPLNDALLEMGIWEEKPEILESGSTWVKLVNEGVNNTFAKILPQYTSHCFRHGLSTRLLEMGIQENVKNFIMGHAAKGEGNKTYANRKPLSQMLDALNKAALQHHQG